MKYKILILLFIIHLFIFGLTIKLETVSCINFSEMPPEKLLCWVSDVTITSVVESKQQRTGNCKREEPHNSNHHCHPPPWAVSGVVEHGHGHGCVSVKVRTDADTEKPFKTQDYTAVIHTYIYFKANSGTLYRGSTMISHYPLKQSGALTPHFTATRIQKQVCWYVKVYLVGDNQCICERSSSGNHWYSRNRRSRPSQT